MSLARLQDDASGDGVSLPPVKYTRATLPYSTAIAVDGNQGDYFTITITNGVAFAIGAPANVPNGKVVTFTLRNTSGGAHGAITWNAVFKMAALAAIATGFSRTITFISDGTNLVEMYKTPADVPN